MSSRVIPGLALLAIFLSTAVAHADELRLKDGTKIIGTIVGFENDSFRVETPYGFALVRKDKVEDINITATKKESEIKKDPEPKTKSSATVVPPPAAGPAVVPTVAKESLSAPRSSSEVSATATAPRASEVTATALAGNTDLVSPKIKAVAAVAPVSPPAVMSPPPEPPMIRDEIRGNMYVNLTYGFRMFKPPSWELIPEARKALPDAVAALGTYDQTTLLVIGRQRARDSLDAHAAATGKALGAVYDNYRLITTRNVSIAGFPAVEQRARGTADGHDWSVLLVTFLKGEDAYTLLGMTWADTDLIQVQENVIAKTVNSLSFTAP